MHRRRKCYDHAMNNCQNCQKEFVISENDRNYYAEIHVSAPTFCPDCRQQRRLAWRNERSLYKRKCDATGKEIVSVFSAEKPFKVYENEYWYSDKWDALNYGRDFDFNRPFFEQFAELMHDVPQLSRSAVGNQNSDYVNQCGWCKNCYLIFEADFDENCFYSNNIYDSRFSLDMLMAVNCELCYECIDCDDSYNLKFSTNSKNCSDSWFLKNCIGCKNCFGCVNLRNKEYHFLNEKYSKEEYIKKIAEINLSSTQSLEQYRQKFAVFSEQFPRKYMESIQNENSTGNYLSFTQNCHSCFDVNHSQDCKFVFNSRCMKKCYDITVFGSQKGAEFCYENHEIGDGVRNIFFSDQVWTSCYDIFYSKLCIQNCHNLFGCMGLKHQNYCILNKQYSREEYEKLLSKIIEHMKTTGEFGQFFPADMSPFAYNETIANDYFPLTKDVAQKQGYKWKDPDPKEYLKQTCSIQKNIDEIQDSIIDEILACTTCGKNYKIIPEELKFYKRSFLPIPEKCPDCRHKTRFAMRNPRQLYDRKCRKCGTQIITTFNTKTKSPIFCEQCYLGSTE